MDGLIPIESQQHELMDSSCYVTDEIAEQNPTELQSIYKNPEAKLAANSEQNEDLKDEREEPTPKGLQSASQNTVETATHKVFDELSEPNPTGLQSTSSLYTMSEAIFFFPKERTYLFDEKRQLISLKLEGMGDAHQLFDEIPMKTDNRLVEMVGQFYPSKPEVVIDAHLMFDEMPDPISNKHNREFYLLKFEWLKNTKHMLDIITGLPPAEQNEGIAGMILFDPGGSSWHRKGCGFTESNSVKQHFGKMPSNLSVELRFGEMLMFVFDPGGSLLLYNSCDPFNCFLNGKPKSCSVPRLVFVGNYLNRNTWESLVCVPGNSVKDRKKVYEAPSNVHLTEAYCSLVFEDYEFIIEFFATPFLVQEREIQGTNGEKNEIATVLMVNLHNGIVFGFNSTYERAPGRYVQDSNIAASMPYSSGTGAHYLNGILRLAYSRVFPGMAPNLDGYFLASASNAYDILGRGALSCVVGGRLYSGPRHFEIFEKIVISFYILEDKNVLEGVGKEVVLIDTTLETTKMIMILGDTVGLATCGNEASKGNRGLDFEKSIVNDYIDAPIMSGDMHTKSIDGLQQKGYVQKSLFELGYMAVTIPQDEMLLSFKLLCFWKCRWDSRKTRVFAVGTDMENFVWNPGLVWVSFRFSTLRTRCSFRGGICHDMTFYYNFNCIFEFTYLAVYDVIY